MAEGRRSIFRVNTEVLATPARSPLQSNLTAAGKRISLAPDAKKWRKAKEPRAWMDHAWRFYDEIGEYRYACNWVGNIASKATLYVEKDGTREEDGPGAEILGLFFGGTDSHGDFLRLLGLHLTVAGEAYVVGTVADDGDEWQVVAASELKVKGGVYEIDGDPLPEDAFLIRVWRAHPLKPKFSDSPSRAALPILSEIHKLTQHVAAQVDSRLTSAGVLLFPDSVEFGSPVTKVSGATPEDDEATTEANSAQSFIDEFVAVAKEAIQDRESASALVPIAATMPADAIKAVKHLKFWSDLDDRAIEMRREGVQRLALSMDMPPEVLTGTGELNHWNAWAVDEASIKAHIEPLLQVITSALTTYLLRDQLLADGMAAEEVAKYAVKAETSAIRLRPNRSKEAIELHQMGALSRAALLRENGFETDDEMDEKERVAWMLQRTALGSPTPEMVGAALVKLKVLDEMPAVDPVDKTNPDQGPSLLEHPTRDIPEQESALIAAANVLVLRALERAGNRMKSQMQLRGTGHFAAELYLHGPKLDVATANSLLEDAWGLVETCASNLGVSAKELELHLDNYTRMLLLDQRAHEMSALADYLHAALAPKAA